MLKIGELARQANTDVQTVRYYEREGLLPTAVRSEGNYRLYRQEHIERLTFIRNCRALDMTLDEIRALLRLRDAPEQCCGPVNDLLDEHIEHVRARICELERLRQSLEALRASCTESQQIEQCRIICGLATAPPKSQKAYAAHEHVAGPHGGLSSDRG